MNSLAGKIAVVTGASRGAGRGIALALGEAGALVYVTGRSTKIVSTENLPENIEMTAEEVSARGGHGIPVFCDHTKDHQVKSLFDRVRKEQGHIDILVNNVWGGYEKLYSARGWDDGTKMSDSFWKQSLTRWDTMFIAGLRAHMVANYFAAPLMITQHRGLIVNTTWNDEGKYLGNVFYDVAKAAVNRLAFALAQDLKK